jgi:HEAT repeat protein
MEGSDNTDVHGITIKRRALPDSVEVPLVGLLDRRSRDSIEYFRKAAESPSASGGWTIKALGLIGDSESSEQAYELLKSDNIFVRYSAAVALTQFGQVEDGKQALRELTGATDDQDNGVYRYSAAERLWRLGEREYVDALFQFVNPKSSYASGPAEILADVTGEYFVTQEDWRGWWDREGKAKFPVPNSGQQSNGGDAEKRRAPHS